MAYYGDDFTGSTDVLESLTNGGVETVLFAEPPDEEVFQRYAQVRAIGIAGRSRMMTPKEMDNALPNALWTLLAQGPRIVHYKISSTFDSSPEIGSIGRAIDIGQHVFQNRYVPLVVGTPALQRFCVFGNLFARSGLDSVPFRLDRHPTMRHHPATPMTEADLRVHLSSQTQRPIALMDVLTLESGYNAVREAVAQSTREAGTIVLFDTITDAHLATIGRVIWESQRQEAKPMFVVGSSGIGNALTMHWQNIGVIEPISRAELEPADRIVVVSGSCSPVTSRQITWAQEHGFARVQVDAAQHFTKSGSVDQIDDVVARSQSELDAGRSVIIHTSGANHDKRSTVAANATDSARVTAERLGGILGRILRELLIAYPIRRIAVVGGDTSVFVARTLGIEALEMLARLEPGAPLCVARSRDAATDGIEITFKGGQVGHDNFFGKLLGRRNDQQAVGDLK